ncbi:helix-turn-helix domain-containing protein [Fusobacterium animalis]|uniref:helix-turn-helix domain-containing protein n=1 Tax=Fusobacterium animalis TaxID=76859 RepID=UPI0030CEE3D2
MSIKKESFFTIQAFMVNDLKLKSNELLIYAIIFGFSQIENQYFTGSLNYLAEWTGLSSKTTVKTILNGLLAKGLLEKEDIYKNGVKYCKYKALTEPKPKEEIKTVSVIKDVKDDVDIGKKNSDEKYIKNCNGISKIDIGISKIDMGVYQKMIQGISIFDNNNIDIHIDNNINHIIEENDFLKIKNWFIENKIDFSKKHQEIILKLLEKNSVKYLLKIFQDEIDILKNNKDVKNISAVFSYHLFNGTVQMDMKEVEKKETEISSNKNEEIKNSLNLEKTLNIFNELPEEKQIEIENKILTENNIKYFTEIKNKSKIFYYRLIGKFIEQELKNMRR